MHCLLQQKEEQKGQKKSKKRKKREKREKKRLVLMMEKRRGEIGCDGEKNGVSESR